MSEPWGVCLDVGGKQSSDAQTQQQYILLYLKPKAIIPSESQSFPRFEFEVNPRF